MAAVFRIVGVRSEIDPKNAVGKGEIGYEDPAVSRQIVGELRLECGPLLRCRHGEGEDGYLVDAAGDKHQRQDESAGEAGEGLQAERRGRQSPSAVITKYCTWVLNS